VREFDPARRVTELEYVPHDSANTVISEVARDVAVKYDDLIALAVVHRVGTLRVGEVAVVVAASAAHRALLYSLHVRIQSKRSRPCRRCGSAKCSRTAQMNG
jgi:molybdopterin synthase catalytic subunit